MEIGDEVKERASEREKERIVSYRSISLAIITDTFA